MHPSSLPTCQSQAQSTVSLTTVFLLRLEGGKNEEHRECGEALAAPHILWLESIIIISPVMVWQGLADGA
eukprot:scaffold278710_cov22-Prasinocladus_malaysianus.AAC.1